MYGGTIPYDTVDIPDAYGELIDRDADAKKTYELYIKNSQTYTIHNAGIPLINSKNIYDISDKSSIIVNIELF